MRGPIVNGMEQSPSKNPTAWEAPEGPQRSYAIGPSIVIKQPSKMPKYTKGVFRYEWNTRFCLLQLRGEANNLDTILIPTQSILVK